MQIFAQLQRPKPTSSTATAADTHLAEHEVWLAQHGLGEFGMSFVGQCAGTGVARIRSGRQRALRGPSSVGLPYTGTGRSWRNSLPRIQIAEIYGLASLFRFGNGAAETSHKAARIPVSIASWADRRGHHRGPGSPSVGAPNAGSAGHSAQLRG